MKLLLDTNVLIDYYAQRMPFAADAIRLRMAAYFGDVELWVCSQSFPDAEYVLRRAIPTKELRQMMSKSMDFFNVCAVSAAEVRDGFESGWPDLEDYFIASAAKRIGADYVVTRDRGCFETSDVPALTPESFFKLMQEEHGVTYEELVV